MLLLEINLVDSIAFLIAFPFSIAATINVYNENLSKLSDFFILFKMKEKLNYG